MLKWIQSLFRARFFLLFSMQVMAFRCLQPLLFLPKSFFVTRLSSNFQVGVQWVLLGWPVWIWRLYTAACAYVNGYTSKENGIPSHQQRLTAKSISARGGAIITSKQRISGVRTSHLVDTREASFLLPQ